MRSFLSPFGFDRFVKGEGAVVVVLKPLDKAIADNDHIYCVASTSSIVRDDYARLPCILASWELD